MGRSWIRLKFKGIVVSMMLQVIAVLSCVCLAAARSPNIVNGKDVDRPGKYPWQGSMQSGTWHFCGCSLISKNWVVTASHCVESGGPSQVVFGMHDQKRRYGSPKGYQVAEIIMHEQYKQGGGFTPNDIALMRIDGEVEFNEHVQPIGLASNADYDVNDECVISGWGRMIVNGAIEYPDVLQETNTQMITMSQCRSRWGSYVSDGVVCIMTGRSTSCQGDSGGPLACRKQGGDWALVGATSWGPADCSVSSPAAYASVPYYQDWIKAKSGIGPGDDVSEGGSGGSGSGGSGSGGNGSGGSDPNCKNQFDVCTAYGQSELQNYCTQLDYMRDACCEACIPYV